ncbi:MAG: UDP-N-acetylmuramoyl-tripeptide--D-alanyl-D-alanine ligase [Candidatus Sumerlaeia bacterium]
MLLTLADLVSATGGELVQGSPNAVVSSFSSDSRSVGRGDAFFALHGPRFNGEHFIAAALELGAAGAIASRWAGGLTGLYPHAFFLRVPDAGRAMGDVAHLIRRRHGGRVALVAGSAGKTTVKEMLAHALTHMRMRALATQKNFNNLIGLPLTLFQLDRRHEAVVLEAGMNEPGELARLTQIADPDVALLTNVGAAHIGKFGSHEALVQAKADMWRHCGGETVFVVNADCPVSRRILRELGRSNPTTTFSITKEADVSVEGIERAHPYGYHFSIVCEGRRLPAFLAMPGLFNVANAAAMAACVRAMGLGLDEAVDSLISFQPRDMRSVVRVAGGVTFLIDCYNCSPDAMRGAIEGLVEMDCAGRRVAVLGDMLELGEAEEYYHEQIGRMSELEQIDALFTLGVRARSILRAARENEGFSGASAAFNKTEDLLHQLLDYLQPGDTVLFKASRLMRFEDLVEPLAAYFERQAQIA